MSNQYKQARNAQFSGIADIFDLSPKLKIPTTNQLRKIRRIASKTRASTACSECRKFKRKCSDHLPCPRCVAMGIEASCSKGNEIAQQAGEVDIPITYNVSTISFPQDRFGKFPKIELKHQWTFQVTRAHWSIGFKIQALMNILNSIPVDMALAIQNLCASIELVKKAKSRMAGSASLHRTEDTDSDFPNWEEVWDV